MPRIIRRLTLLCTLALILPVILLACGSDAPSATPASDEARPTPKTPLANTSPETDREALVALYNATDGPNWANNENWLSGDPIGEWYGVRTDDNGRVTWLFLYENRLSGEIPAELGNLANLTQMALSGNELSGAIPSELSNLSNLEGLSLSDNELSGEIPSELGQLSNLESLVLSDNELRGCVPSSLQDRLIMAFSDLGGLPFCGAEPAPTTIELA